jgi:membrane protein
MKMKNSIRTLWGYLKEVMSEFFDNNVIKYSASLAYYTTFSIAPLLVIVIHVAGLILGDQAMEGVIYDELHGLVGPSAAEQLQLTIQNVHMNVGTSLATTVSFIVLLFGATGIFAEMQDSLNKIWGLKAITTKKAWWKMIIDRLVSFSMIVSLGFVMLVSLALSAIVMKLTDILKGFIGDDGEVILTISDHLLSVVSTTIIFAAIFKVLPDAKIKWRDVIVGALITSLLFLLGKILIGLYLSSSKLASLFDAAGSVILIMLWVYYSSAILYLGAVFTKVYAAKYGGKIQPSKYATWIATEEKPIDHIPLKESH